MELHSNNIYVGEVAFSIVKCWCNSHKCHSTHTQNVNILLICKTIQPNHCCCNCVVRFVINWKLIRFICINCILPCVGSISFYFSSFFCNTLGFVKSSCHLVTIYLMNHKFLTFRAEFGLLFGIASIGSMNVIGLPICRLAQILYVSI